MNIFKILTLALLVNEGVAAEQSLQDIHLDVHVKSIARCQSELFQALKSREDLAKQDAELKVMDVKVKKLIQGLELAPKNLSGIKELALEASSESTPITDFSTSDQQYQKALREQMAWLQGNSESISSVYSGLQMPKEVSLFDANLKEVKSSNLLTLEGAKSSLNLLTQILENTDVAIKTLTALNEKIAELLKKDVETSIQLSQMAHRRAQEIKVFTDTIIKHLEGK